MAKPRAWTVEKFNEIHRALMALSEPVKGTNYRVVKRSGGVGLGKLVWHWLHDNSSHKLGIGDVDAGLRYLVYMKILEEPKDRKQLERLFYSSIKITEKLIDDGYNEARTRYT